MRTRSAEFTHATEPAADNQKVDADTPATEEELERILLRAEAATAAPWRSSIEDRDHWSGDNVILTGGPDIFITYYVEEPLDFQVRVRNQDFIAAARQDVPRLVAEVRRLQRLLRESTS